jgi:hypothetical protein
MEHHVFHPSLEPLPTAPLVPVRTDPERLMFHRPSEGRTRTSAG